MCDDRILPQLKGIQLFRNQLATRSSVFRHFWATLVIFDCVNFSNYISRNTDTRASHKSNFPPCAFEWNFLFWLTTGKRSRTLWAQKRMLKQLSTTSEEWERASWYDFYDMWRWLNEGGGCVALRREALLASFYQFVNWQYRSHNDPRTSTSMSTKEARYITLEDNILCSNVEINAFSLKVELLSTKSSI